MHPDTSVWAEKIVRSQHKITLWRCFKHFGTSLQYWGFVHKGWKVTFFVCNYTIQDKLFMLLVFCLKYKILVFCLQKSTNKLQLWYFVWRKVQIHILSLSRGIHCYDGNDVSCIWKEIKFFIFLVEGLKLAPVYEKLCLTWI